MSTWQKGHLQKESTGLRFINVVNYVVKFMHIHAHSHTQTHPQTYIFRLKNGFLTFLRKTQDIIRSYIFYFHFAGGGGGS